VKSPAFQLYPNDFLGSAKVGMMTTEEIGAYLLLLLLDWQEDGFDYQAPRLARWCRLPTARFTKAWGAIGPCFTADAAGRLRNPRLERERIKQADWREKSSNGGKSKWGSTPEQVAEGARSQRLADARKKATHSKDEWEEMLSAFGGTCVRCGATDRKIVKDHVVPIYQGGSDGIANLQPLCARCNSSKGPETVDHRPKAWQLAGRAPSQMPAKWVPSACTPFPFPFPSPVTTTAPTGIAPVGASRDVPVADAPQPAPEPPAPPKPSPYPKFVAQFGDRWAALVGKPDFGRIAGDLKDLHRVHGPTVLLGALENFARHRSIAVAQGTTRPDGWPQFVADFADYIPKRGAAA
jgi:5-methylcytosine-specific restriction endonuclease McrA